MRPEHSNDFLFHPSIFIFQGGGFAGGHKWGNRGGHQGLLKLASPSPPPLKFRDGKSIRCGDGIVVVRYPRQELPANQVHVTTGTVSAMAGPGNDTRILQITAPVQPGNSGGPLLDTTGNIVGIVLAKLDAIKTAGRTPRQGVSSPAQSVIETESPAAGCRPRSGLS